MDTMRPLAAHLAVVLANEEPPVVEVHSLTLGDEARLLDDLEARRDRLGREILGAVDDAIALLRQRTARLTAADVGRRAA
jgi:hypothetical protein